MINVANDMIRSSDEVRQNQTSFETMQQQFEVLRGVMGVVLPPSLGVVNELSSGLFQVNVKTLRFYYLHMFLRAYLTSRWLWDNFKINCDNLIITFMIKTLWNFTLYQ